PAQGQVQDVGAAGGLKSDGTARLDEHSLDPGALDSFVSPEEGRVSAHRNSPWGASRFRGATPSPVSPALRFDPGGPGFADPAGPSPPSPRETGSGSG